MYGKKWKNPAGTRAYFAWRNMRSRCYNPKNASYKYYGGQGITVCKRWRDNYDAFYDDMGDPPEDMSLDRINNSKGYSPKNCRWATNKQQHNNRRDNVRITCFGKTKTITEWAEWVGVSVDTMWKRLYVHKIPPRKALSATNLATKPIICGTRRAYEKGCRCEKCREVHNARMRHQRKRRKEVANGSQG